MSAKYNLVCEQGTTFNLQFVIKNDSTPWDLTGYSATMTVKPFLNSDTTTVSATNINGLITLGGSTGRITVNIPSSMTTNFSPNRYVYDLILDSGGTITRILEGKFVVTGAVTV